ncbi:MAG: methyltransferase [Byssovorax sp.]
MVAAHDFGAYASLVDVGGGGAQLLAGVLAAYPRLRGVVYDLEASLGEAAATLREAGVEERAEIVAGSFYTSVPVGHDAYLLRQILHGQADRELALVLRNVRAAMRPGAKIIILETLVPEPGARGAHPSFLDLQMLIGSGGRERTRAQYAALLEAHGMRLLEVTRTASPTAVYVGEAR